MVIPNAFACCAWDATALALDCVKPVAPVGSSQSP